MPLSDHQIHGSDRATGKLSHRESVNYLWIVVRAALIVVSIVGLWRMGPRMRVIVMVAGVAAMALLGAVVVLIIRTVKKERRDRRDGIGQTATPIE